MSAEPTLQPIDYEPALNAEGNSYVDKVPPTTLLSRGIKCNCSGRTTFTSRSSLLAHFKSITHQTWLESQNRNKNNHFMEVIQLRDLVKQQQILIAERDKEIIDMKQLIRRKDTVIRELSSIIHNSSTDNQEVNVLDIDL